MINSGGNDWFSNTTTDWVHEIKKGTVFLIFAACVVQVVEMQVTHGLNIVLLRSFPATSEKWCFVRHPAKKTRLQWVQNAFKVAIAIGIVLMRWPGGIYLNKHLWECALIGMKVSVWLEAGMFFLILGTDWFIWIGHELALSAGWVACPPSPSDFSYYTEHAGHTPGTMLMYPNERGPHGAFRHVAARKPQQQHQPQTRCLIDGDPQRDEGNLENGHMDELYNNKNKSPEPDDNSLSTFSGSRTSLFDSLHESISRNIPWLSTRSMRGSISTLSTPTKYRRVSERQSTNDSSTLVGDSEESFDPSLMAVSTGLRRQFT